MSKQAWFCPACQKHHAPHCDTCPAGELRLLPVSTVTRPVDAIGKDRMPVYYPNRWSAPFLNGYRPGR